MGQLWKVPDGRTKSTLVTVESSEKTLLQKLWPGCQASFEVMKSLSLFSIAVGVLLATGCGTIRRDDSAVTTFQLSGPAGAKFSGYLMQYGERVYISNVTPWTYESPGITGFEITKARRDVAMDLETFYDEGNAAHTSHAIAIPAGVIGVHGQVMNHGMEMELVP